MKTSKTLTLGQAVAMGLLWSTATNPQTAIQTMTITPVLDGHAYTLSGHVMIDIGNQFIHFNSNMTACRQADGEPPLDTQGWALATNSQFIGLSRFSFNTHHNRLYLNSETNDVLCDHAVYVDTLFAGNFD